MLMALYNVSISVKGLKYISESSGLLQLIWTLLDGRLVNRKHPVTGLLQHRFCFKLECVVFGDFKEEMATSSVYILDCRVSLS